jgi:C4-dicarboxylate-specific signal transduction histidine kinase
MRSPEVLIDKHKVLQILVNLINNGRDALTATTGRKRVLTICTTLDEQQCRLRIEIRDNGVGIPKENITRIFSHGFTTKRNGHGFGLHCSANVANEMEGALHVHSDGVDQGAVFTLELPFVPARVAVPV